MCFCPSLLRCHWKLWGCYWPFDKHMQLLTVYAHVNILFMSCKCRLICHCHGFYFHSSVDSSSINYEHCSHGSIPWECIFQILCNLFQVKASAKLRWYPILTFCNQVSSQITVAWQESLPGWAPSRYSLFIPTKNHLLISINNSNISPTQKTTRTFVSRWQCLVVCDL